MRKNILFLVLIILSLAVFNFDSYSAEEAISTAETDPAIDAALKAGFSSLFKEDNVPAAIQQFEQAITLDAGNYAAYYGLGSAYLKQGDLDKAKDCFERSIAANYEDPASYDGLGKYYFQIGDLKNAEEYFNKAIILDEKNPWFNFDLGMLYSRNQNKEAALKQAEILATLDPNLESELRKKILADNPVDPI